MSNFTPVGAELLYNMPAAVTKNTFTAQAVISQPNTAPRALVRRATSSAVSVARSSSR